MDWTNIIVAGMALLGTAFGSIMGVLTSNKMTVYRIDQLEKKVDKHNEVIKRTYVLEEQMKVANHRIEDLESEERI